MTNVLPSLYHFDISFCPILLLPQSYNLSPKHIVSPNLRIKQLTPENLI